MLGGEQLSSMLLNSRIQLDDDWKNLTDCGRNKSPKNNNEFWEFEN